MERNISGRSSKPLVPVRPLRTSVASSNGSRLVFRKIEKSWGELYDREADPHQHDNLWNDPARRALRDALVDDLRTHLPPLRRRLRVDAPT